MFVSRSMTRKVITIDKDADILEAKDQMAHHGIRHLPIVENDDLLIGIVTDRDIRSALPSELYSGKKKERLSGIKVKDIMTKDPVTIPPSHTIQDALLLIQRKRFGAFPVADEKGRLKGIISVRDLLRAFINVLGIKEPGTLLCIIMDDKVGELKKVVDIITAANISFGSILGARYWEKGKRAVFPYLLTLNVGHVKRELQKMGYTLLDPMEWYMDQLPQNV